MQFKIDDRGFTAFLHYAERERSLDESLRAAQKYGRGEEHERSIDALRQINKRVLFRETEGDASR